MKITIEIEAKYDPYSTEAKNIKADRQIKNWLRSLLDMEHIPLYIDKDENGSAIEDCTRRLKVKFK